MKIRDRQCATCIYRPRQPVGSARRPETPLYRGGPASGAKTCSRCADLQRRRALEPRERRIAAGLCAECGGERDRPRPAPAPPGSESIERCGSRRRVGCRIRGMSPDTVWIISTVITVGVALAGFMAMLVSQVIPLWVCDRSRGTL